MSDLPQPSPDNAPEKDEAPARNVPTPLQTPISASKIENSAVTKAEQTTPATEISEAEIEHPIDPEAQAADREGFRFIGIGFAIFFVIIAVCAGIVAIVMKNMGI